jgi:subtilisin family serine protease
VRPDRGGGPSVAVLDTGLQTEGDADADASATAATVPGDSRTPVAEVLRDHCQLPDQWRLVPSGDLGCSDEDLADENDDGFLDRAAGHGTFIAGVIARLCPDADVWTTGAVTSFGDGDDFTFAAALGRMFASGAPDVVNLSFGGYTEHDEEPLATRAILDEHRGDGTVFVASAGNDGTCRPSWPAAFADVVAVGALTSCGQPAWFTNWGHWVDACAPGVDVVSTFLRHEGTEIEDADGEALHVEAFDGWASWTGTSFAAPKVAAAIAREMVISGCDPQEAAHRVVRAHGLFRAVNLGTVVNLV